MKAKEEDEEEEGSGKQREVLLGPATRGGSVTARPNRKHSQTARRTESGDEEWPRKRREWNQVKTSGIRSRPVDL